MVTDAQVQEIRLRAEKFRKSREDLQAKRDRLRGHVEAAEKALQEAESACREKGIDPDKIDEVMEKLRNHYHTQLDAAEQAMAKIQDDLSAMEQDA